MSSVLNQELKLNAFTLASANAHLIEARASCTEPHPVVSVEEAIVET